VVRTLEFLACTSQRLRRCWVPSQMHCGRMHQTMSRYPTHRRRLQDLAAGRQEITSRMQALGLPRSPLWRPWRRAVQQRGRDARGVRLATTTSARIDTHSSSRAELEGSVTGRRAADAWWNATLQEVWRSEARTSSEARSWRCPLARQCLLASGRCGVVEFGGDVHAPCLRGGSPWHHGVCRNASQRGQVLEPRIDSVLRRARSGVSHRGSGTVQTALLWSHGRSPCACSTALSQVGPSTRSSDVSPHPACAVRAGTCTSASSWVGSSTMSRRGSQPDDGRVGEPCHELLFVERFRMLVSIGGGHLKRWRSSDTSTLKTVLGRISFAGLVGLGARVFSRPRDVHGWRHRRRPELLSAAHPRCPSAQTILQRISTWPRSSISLRRWWISRRRLEEHSWRGGKCRHVRVKRQVDGARAARLYDGVERCCRTQSFGHQESLIQRGRPWLRGDATTTRRIHRRSRFARETKNAQITHT